MPSPVFDMMWTEIKGLRPSFLSKKPHFNFITAHYFWILGLTILASILLYASGQSGTGELAYIDALFFASGANTQAGLNTVDVNLLNTFQQVVITFCAMMSNPITINSFVVVLRLYWFQKKFQHVVRDARERRGTISKSKTMATPTDLDQIERGVNGRDIRVMHNGARSRIANDGALLGCENGKESSNGSSISPNTSPQHGLGIQRPATEPQEIRSPAIKFAGTVKRSDGLEDETVKLPRERTDEEHIAILERQRNGNHDEVLRIPGPMDVERGLGPKRVDHSDEEEHEPQSPRRQTFNGEAARPDQSRGLESRQQAITIQEPERPQPERQQTQDRLGDNLRAFSNALIPFRFRKPRVLNRSDQRLHHEEDQIHVTPSKARRRQTFDHLRTVFTRDKDEDTPYLSWQPTLGRNSAFPDLTEEQREELGGIEYRSLKTLILILACYFWGFWLFSIACLTPWIKNSTYGKIVDNDGQSRTWWGIFTGNSAFTDLGFTLTPDSMNSFNTAIFPLLLMSFLIVIGNTGFPVMLRFIIWVTNLFVTRHSGLYEELRFLLDHPRRCFTLLFPAPATWWLFWLLVILNGIDLIFFIILDLGTGPVSDLPAGIRILDGLFQAASTRTAGFSCVNLANLHPGVQTSYMIMMYISVFPIAISVRRTNVYEEDSLGIYAGNGPEEDADASDLSYVGAHLRRQLSFDLWYIFIGFFILSISEGPRVQNGDYSMFAILFEIVSAYGTVGLSLGYTNINASLCSQFTVVGKLVIIAMQIRGRHRGLPYGLDRAVLLPSDKSRKMDAAAEAHQARMNRRNSAVSVATTRDGRGTSIARGRTKSVDKGGNDRVNRVNSNLITNFLHIGPAMPPVAPPDFPSARRANSDLGTDEHDLEPYQSIPERSDAYSMMSRRSGRHATRDDV